MSKYKKVGLVLIGILIITLIIGVVINTMTSNNTLGNKEEQQSTDYNPVYKDDVTENTANLGYVINKASTDNINIQTESIIENTNILDTTNSSYSITRFQLATIIYNIIVAEGKLSDETPINIAFDDNDDIPIKYFKAVAITSNLGILQYSGSFEGYRYATKKEVDDAFSKLNVYLNNWTNEYNTENIDNDFDEDQVDDNFKNLQDTAVKVLNNRDTEDKLNGDSVAIYNEPKTLSELITNIDSIEAFDIYDKSLCNKYGSSDRIYFDYINLDEGLLNYDAIYNLSINSDPDYLIDDINLMGLTITEPASFTAEIVNNDQLILTNYDVLTNISWFNSGATKCFGMFNYSIVSSGDFYSDVQNPLIALDNKKIDSIGVLVRKDILENVQSNSDNLSNSYILVVIPLLNSIDMT